MLFLFLLSLLRPAARGVAKLLKLSRKLAGLPLWGFGDNETGDSRNNSFDLAVSSQGVLSGY